MPLTYVIHRPGYGLLAEPEPMEMDLSYWRITALD